MRSSTRSRYDTTKFLWRFLRGLRILTSVTSLFLAVFCIWAIANGESYRHRNFEKKNEAVPTTTTTSMPRPTLKPSVGIQKRKERSLESGALRFAWKRDLEMSPGINQPPPLPPPAGGETGREGSGGGGGAGGVVIIDPTSRVGRGSPDLLIPVSSLTAPPSTEPTNPTRGTAGKNGAPPPSLPPRQQQQTQQTLTNKLSDHQIFHYFLLILLPILGAFTCIKDWPALNKHILDPPAVGATYIEELRSESSLSSLGAYRILLGAILLALDTGVTAAPVLEGWHLGFRDAIGYILVVLGSVSFLLGLLPAALRILRDSNGDMWITYTKEWEP